MLCIKGFNYLLYMLLYYTKFVVNFTSLNLNMKLIQYNNTLLYGKTFEENLYLLYKTVYTYC